MSNVRRWYWPSVLLPGALGIVVATVLADDRPLLVLRFRTIDAIGMAGALYAAVTLLGYLLLTFRRLPSLPPTHEYAPARGQILIRNDV